VGGHRGDVVGRQHLGVLDAVAGGAHRRQADLVGRSGDAVQDRGQRGVADGVEAGLQARARAGGDVPRDLLGGQVGVAARRLVEVRGRQAGGVAPEGAVGEQVAARADRAELAGPVDGAELAPVADPLDAVLEPQQGREVVLAADVRSAALVDAGDAEGGGPVQGGRLGRPPLRRADGGVRGPPHHVVGLPADEPVADEARAPSAPPARGEQRARGDRAVHVGAREVDDAAVRRAVRARRPSAAALGPRRVVPAGAEQDAAAQGPRRRPRPGRGRRPATAHGEVEPGQRQAGGRRVHVGVDERGRHPGVLEVDDDVRGQGVGGALAPDPDDLGPSTSSAVANGSAGERTRPRRYSVVVTRRSVGSGRSAGAPRAGRCGRRPAGGLCSGRTSRYGAAMTTISLPEATVEPHDVHDVLRRHLLVDGFDLVLDLEASSGSRLVDARDGTAYLDLFTFFASSALGMNSPALVGDPAFRDQLLTAAMNKPSNSDVYSSAMASFVDTFARVLGDPGLPHLFFVEGGALAVENALKVAFDWKSRWNEAHGRDPRLGTKVLHLRDAFHGRSGYTHVAHQHRPGQGRPLPAVRLAAHPVAVPVLDGRRRAARARGPRRPPRPPSSSTPTTSPASSWSRSRARAATTTSARSSCRRCRRLCVEHDALFVLDEVQSGCG
jgi:hypothetical protein